MPQPAKPSSDSLADYLQLMVPTESNISLLLQKIRGTLFSIHASPALDLDSLAQEILIDAWTNSRPVTSQMILHRYINFRKAEHAHKSALERSIYEGQFVDDETEDSATERRSKLSEIIGAAGLSALEFQTIALVFFFSKTYSQAARDLNWSETKFREVFNKSLEQLKKAGRLIQSQQRKDGV